MSARWSGSASRPGTWGDLEGCIRLETSFGLDQFSPIPWARNVTIPTLFYQVRDDVYTRPADVQLIYDNIPAEKELFWIEGTTRRWDGYTYFQREPARILNWFARVIG